MTLDEQIEYMKVGQDALITALLYDDALVNDQVRATRIDRHFQAYGEIIESLARLRGLEK